MVSPNDGVDMTQDNASLVEAFVNGDTSGKSNRMEIVEGPVDYNGEKVAPGETALIGYGWAMYAKRTKGGRVTAYWGWVDWAKSKRGNNPGKSTTERHMDLLDDELRPTDIISGQSPQVDDAPDSVNRIYNPRRRTV